jgi:hypothetical protein
MSPYEFRYKINDQTIAQLCEDNLINQVILHQVEQAVKLYLSNKSYSQLDRMSREGDENFPRCYVGDPDFTKKEDLLQFVLDMIHMEYDIPEGYITSEVDAMQIEPLKDGEKTSNLIY